MSAILASGGHVAGRDIVVSTIAADAASMEEMALVLEARLNLEHQMADLAEAPPGLRADAQDQLRKAHQAGAQGDKQRLVEKLGTAQRYLERIGQTLPAGQRLAQTLATGALRISGQG